MHTGPDPFEIRDVDAAGRQLADDVEAWLGGSRPPRRRALRSVFAGAFAIGAGGATLLLGGWWLAVGAVAVTWGVTHTAAAFTRHQTESS